MRTAIWLCVVLAGCDLFRGPNPPGDPEVSPDAMVAAHNRIRAGAEPAPSPPLPDLTWLDSAAAVAEGWASECTFAHNPDRGALGENVYATTATATDDEVVDSWASEVAHYHLDTDSCDPDELCGHYTQLVWRNTLQVGCAVRRCTQNSPFDTSSTWELWVCDYAPPGNVVGQTPY